MSMNGFSTFQRLLGKKSKSQNISKSTTNLTIGNNRLSRPLSQYDNTSATPLSSQMDTTSSSSYEQNFRVTVLLPKGQLFVARLGARTDLEKLLLLVCENKQLDPTKYELRHPGDNSQVFSLEQTIGQVGLTEIRLCNKLESYDNFNTGEILTLRNTVGRDSLSSSELSSRNSKHTLKTASQYSSTNSLNSSDSAGMSNSRSSLAYVHSPTSLQTLPQQKPPVAPARKKRAAPRPPSQNSQVLTNGNDSGESQQEEKTQSLQTPTTPESKQPNLGRKEHHVSTPNLAQSSEMSLLRTVEFHKSNVSVDCNGNSRNSRDNNSISNGSSNSYLHYNGSTEVESRSSINPNLSPNGRPLSMSVLNYDLQYEEKELNGNKELNVNGSVSDLSNGVRMPEPAPRKRLVISKKKAPAPPPRGLTPVATPRSSTSSNTPPAIAEVSQHEESSTAEQGSNQNYNNNSMTVNETKVDQPQEDGRHDSPTPLSVPSTPTIKITPTIQSSQLEVVAGKSQNQKDKTESPKIQIKPANLTNGHSETVSISNGPSTPSTPLTPLTPLTPITPSSPATHSQLEAKISSGTSSDDDDQVKVYNIKLGKTIPQPRDSRNGSEESTEDKAPDLPRTPQPLQSLSVQTESTSSPVSTMSPASPQRPESPEWSYTIPAPPTFADNETVAATYRSEGSDRVSPTNRSLLSDQDDSLTTAGDFHSETTITSDIEDGYRGVGSKQPMETQSPSPQPDKVIQLTVRTKVQENVSITKEQSDRLASPNGSPPRSPVETKAEVITELNSLINRDNGPDLNTIMKRNHERASETKIEAAKPSELVNFTIQSYTSSTSISNEQKVIGKSDAALETKKIQTVEEVQTSKDLNNSEKSAVSKKVESPDEGVYIKSTMRPSLTSNNSVVGHLSRQRIGNVVRSDSFHSTRIEARMEPGNLSQSRSTSHVSLEVLQAQSNLADNFLDTNRRKSSSELSIGETPSLQSLKIMKSILNSRNNSLTNGAVGADSEPWSPLETIPPTPTTPAPPMEIRNTSVIETVSAVYKRPTLKDFVSQSGEEVSMTDSLERTHYVEARVVEKSNSKHTECTNTSLVENRANELKNNAINSRNLYVEEPLTKQVNGNLTPPPNTSDCDSSKENSPKNKIIRETSTEAKPPTSVPEPSERIYRYQGPPSINLSTWSERPKSQVAIKSDNDYKFGVGTGRTRLSISSEIKPEPAIRDGPTAPARTPFVRSVEYKKAASLVEPVNHQTVERRPSDDNGIVFSHTQLGRPMSVNNPLTFGRTLPKAGKSNFTPVVKGFKSLEPVMNAEVEQSKDELSHNVTRSVSVMRSNSAVSTNILRLSTVGSGLQPVSINIAKKEPPPPPAKQPEVAPFFSQVALRRTGLKEKILANEDTVDSTPKLRTARSLIEQQNCAKLEMKITNTIAPNPNRYSTPAPTANFNSISNSYVRSGITINSEIPPPPPPIIRSVVTKQNSACIPDTRDQLLSAIRNFNKDSLKRS